MRNLNQILDAGKNKFLPEGIMKSEIEQIDNLVRISQKGFIKGVPLWDSDEEDYLEVDEMPNPDYKRPTPSIQKWIDADYYKHDTDKRWEYMCSPAQVKYKKEKILSDPNLKKSIYGFLGIIPFNPSVMINISPDWKGLFDLTSIEGKHPKALLSSAIETYLGSCNRYSKWKYCLECGGEGNFLHAHIVAEINPDCVKSVMTHINKGSHKYELMKAWDKYLKGQKSLPYAKWQSGKDNLKGKVGLLKGKFAVQRIILNHPSLRDDKLKYLIEANKPEGHTNAFDLNFVRGDF